jgi:hypothetical protein
MIRTNRREYERFALQPMYTSVSVRVANGQGVEYDGHVHNASEGGIQIELDDILLPGTPVEVTLRLPGFGREGALERSVQARGMVVWLAEDPDEPGPSRMAIAFSNFASAEDHDRLVNHLGSGRYARVA